MIEQSVGTLMWRSAAARSAPMPIMSLHGEDRGRLHVVEQLRGRGVAARRRKIALDDRVRLDLDAALGHRADEAVHAHRADRRRDRPGDAADLRRARVAADAASRDTRPFRGRSARGPRFSPSMLRSTITSGSRAPARHLREHRVLARRRDHQPVDALFLQHAQIVALLGGIVVGVAEEHAVAVASRSRPRRRAPVRRNTGSSRSARAGRWSPSSAPSASARPPTARSRARRIARSTFARTSADTGRELFTTCDTVVNDTPGNGCHIFDRRHNLVASALLWSDCSSSGRQATGAYFSSQTAPCLPLLPQPPSPAAIPPRAVRAVAVHRSDHRLTRACVCCGRCPAPPPPRSPRR